MDYNKMKSGSNLLVHVCCAPCSTSVFEKLHNDGYLVEGFFYNPNIHPHEEYTRRLEELLLFMNAKNQNITVRDADFDMWYESVKGLESEKEGARRCEVCFKLRLEETAIAAISDHFDGFTTTLTVSPHKNADLINKIGKELEDKYGIYFLEANFKKNNGFKRAMELSGKYNLYKQSYCGCEFSIRDKKVSTV